jgi:hypothetical protein
MPAIALALGVYAAWKLGGVLSQRLADAASAAVRTPPPAPAPRPLPAPAPPPPRRPSREEFARLAKSRLSSRLWMIEKAELEPAQREAAKAKARQQYLRELDRVLQ